MPEEPPPHHRDFAELYRATIAPLRRYLSRLLGNTGEAQEVAHDAYVKVYPKDGGTAPDKPEALLYTVARRLAINRLKRRSISPVRREAANYDTAVASEPGVAQQVMTRQELDLLEKAVAELPNGCRSVLLLRTLEHLSHKEIGARLDIAVSTVEKQHARALRLLREALPNELVPTRRRELPGQEANL
jgi:RNA polymerase sigma factor (sigma-70 family)